MLEKNLKSFEDCVHCGKCLTVCPTYNATLNEFYGPRGRVRLILKENKIDVALNAKNVNDSMSLCLLCGRCSKICPNGVKVGDMIVNEKIKLTPYLKKNIKSYESSLALTMLKSKSKFLLNAVLKTAKISAVQKFMGRYYPNPEGKPFIKDFDMEFESDGAGKKVIRVGYFSGCVFNSIYPKISKDTVFSLTSNGINVFVPESQGCCGLPFISSGDIKSFKEQALKNARAFNKKGLDYIVTSCASCYYAINKLYPLYFSEADEGFGEIAEFVGKLTDIWHFFKIIADEKDKKIEIKKGKLINVEEIVFHKPCHLENSPDFRAESQNEKAIGEAGFIVDHVDGLVLKPLKHNYCCGNGGIFNIRHYELSKQITKRKFEEIMSVSPQTITTSCSGCIFSLKDQKGIVPGDRDIPVKHLISIYAESIKI